MRFVLTSCLICSVQDVGRVPESGGLSFPRNALDVKLGFSSDFFAFSSYFLARCIAHPSAFVRPRNTQGMAQLG